MKSRKRFLLGAINAIVLALFAASPCVAIDTAMLPGSQRGSTKIVLSEGIGYSTRNLGFFSWSRTSHCCEVTAMDPGVLREDAYFYGSIRNTSLNTVVSHKSRGLAIPVIPSFIGHPAMDDTRWCFAIGIEYGGYLEIPVRLGNVDSHYAQQNVECIETTLFGGYNTNVTDFNFLEISNILQGTEEAAVNAYMTVTDLSGIVLVDSQNYRIQPGTRTDIDIHSIVGPAKYGTITIAHDGPPGALKAALTQYRVQSWSPLDFYPVAREVFTTR